MSSVPSGKMRHLARFLEHLTAQLLGQDSSEAIGKHGHLGLALACAFLAFSGVWIFSFSQGTLHWASLSLPGAGLAVWLVSRRSKLTLRRGNLLALSTHVIALLTFYYFSTHYLLVVYYTDSMVGTYMGIVKTLQAQNPYLLSIKPFLDQFGFAASRYTPRVDGSFEFGLNYPALNFLSLLPLYVAGLNDLRDGVLVFHLMSILLVFGVAPSRLKSLTLVPFSLGLPYAIVFSWTDQVWVFFLLLAAALWYRSPRLSLVAVGLAGAVKQVALAPVPFLMIRLWHETQDSGKRLVNVLGGLAIVLFAFIVPNVPFILSAPSAWWAGTVRPFLPTDVPLVPGGVGLSGILQDVGIAFSPSFFTALTIIVGVAAVFLFATRFSTLNRYLWTMPILVFFFYSRSFPNYMVYWGLPLVTEMVTRPSVGLLKSAQPTSAQFAWSRLPRLSLKAMQRKLAPSLLVLLTITGVVAGVSVSYVSEASRLKGHLEVTSISDPDSLGTATIMTVTLSNHESFPIIPRFFVKWYFIPFSWLSNSTALLASGLTDSYALTATDSFAGIPRGSAFFVMAYDSITGGLVAQSGVAMAEIAEPAVENPYFKWWTLDLSTGLSTPYKWSVAGMKIKGMSGSISPLDPNGLGGLEMRIDQTMSVGPCEVVLSQKLLFANTNLKLFAYQAFTTNVSNKVMTGVKVTDGRHLLYVVFSSTANQKAVTRYPQNSTVTIPVQSSVWTWVQANIPSLWNAEGWSTPETLDLSLFLDAGVTGYFYVQVSELLPD